MTHDATKEAILYGLYFLYFLVIAACVVAVWHYREPDDEQ